MSLFTRLASVRELDVRVDEASRDKASSDESGLAPVRPLAVLVPTSTAALGECLALASETSTRVVFRGGGTGKAGGCIPDEDGLVVDLTGLPRRLEVSPEDRLAEVSGSVITAELHRAADAAGLFFGPDPSSWEASTLGGNIATNASGPASYKYGDMRRWTLGVELVTATGRCLTMERRVTKASVGLDLTPLVVGSEGTLGAVTRAWLRLLPAPERLGTAAILLDSELALPRAFAAMDRMHLAPRSCELLDRQTLEVLRTEGRGHALTRAGVGCVLLLELEGSERQLEVDLERLASLDAVDVLIATEPTARARLGSIRREMSLALRRSAAFKLSEDVVVPRSRLVELLTLCERLGRTHGLRMPAYGHAGDGNLHVNLLWDTPETGRSVAAAMRDLFVGVVALGGTLSGEHGIGRAKAAHRALAHPEPVLEAQRALQALFDPKGILVRECDRT